LEAAGGGGRGNALIESISFMQNAISPPAGQRKQRVARKAARGVGRAAPPGDGSFNGSFSLKLQFSFLKKL